MFGYVWILNKSDPISFIVQSPVDDTRSLLKLCICSISVGPGPCKMGCQFRGKESLQHKVQHLGVMHCAKFSNYSVFLFSVCFVKAEISRTYPHASLGVISSHIW